MFKEEFIAGLATRYKAKNDDDRNTAFREDLDLFTMACPENHLQEVFNWVRLEHKYSTPFLLSKIYDYAKKQGYVAKRATKRDPYWNVCKNCGAKYSNTGRGCPKCRCTESIIETDELLPDNLIEVQEDCFYCIQYPESIKKENERKMYFQGCEDYGVKQSAMCESCKCKECCKQMMMYRADPVGTTEKYKSTELANVLIKEVQPLNETVRQMVVDIAKHRGR